MTRLTQEGRIDYNRKCEQWLLQWSAEKGKKFYYTPEWEKCRDEFLDGREKVCCKCGSTDRICVDHILPLRRFPKYKFFHENFQLLCGLCNRDKGNTIEVREINDKLAELNKIVRKNASTIDNTFYADKHGGDVILGEPIVHEDGSFDVPVDFRGQSGRKFYNDVLLPMAKAYKCEPEEVIKRAIRNEYEERNNEKD